MKVHDYQKKPKIPYQVIRPRSEDDWSSFLVAWGGEGSETTALRSIIRAVRAAGARDVVVESGYADLDQLSEAEYWSREFAQPHTEVFRMHFFSTEIDEATFPTKKQDGYLGYAVLTGPLARLVRALIPPPPCMVVTAAADSAHGSNVICSHCGAAQADSLVRGGKVVLAPETVELFGIDYDFQGVPYCGQEAWHLQCGHAVAWTCLYAAYLLGRAPRTTLRDAVEAGADARVDPQRAISSTGTNLFQLQHIFTDRGMPALAYKLSDLVDDPRLKLEHVRREELDGQRRAIFGVVCSYLNSGFPVVATTEDHAVTIIGWRHATLGEGVELLYSDSHDPFAVLAPDAAQITEWDYLMIPLPPNVVLSGEGAQAAAYEIVDRLEQHVRESLAEMATELQGVATEIQRRFHDGEFSLRMELKRRQQYKRAVLAEIGTRGEAIAAELGVLRLPEWIWVAEFQDRSSREEGTNPVIAELLFDTTSPDESPHVCAVSLGSYAWTNWPYDPRSMQAKPVRAESDSASKPHMWSSQINTQGSEGIRLNKTVRIENDSGTDSAAPNPRTKEASQ